MVARPEARAAQVALARDITVRTHGAAAAEQAIADSAARFSTEAITDPESLRRLYESSGGFTFQPEWLAAGTAVLLAETALSASRGEARRLIANGGVTVNGQRVTDPAFVPEPVAGEWLDVRRGSAAGRSGAKRAERRRPPGGGG